MSKQKIDIASGRYWGRPWSLVDGCTPVSEACDNCWLKAMTRFTHADFSKVIARQDRLEIPLKKKSPTVYAIWSDLFHKDVANEFIFKVLNVMDKAYQHTFLILTKRPERMIDIPSRFCDFMGYGIGQFETRFHHVWFGVTSENQRTWDERVPILSKMKHFGHTFVSVEPMLSPIATGMYIDAIDLVIVGGESGQKSRFTNTNWIRSIKDQCEKHEVGFFFKGLPFIAHKTKQNGRYLDGKTYDFLPWFNAKNTLDKGNE